MRKKMKNALRRKSTWICLEEQSRKYWIGKRKDMMACMNSGFKKKIHVNPLQIVSTSKWSKQSQKDDKKGNRRNLGDKKRNYSLKI